MAESTLRDAVLWHSLSNFSGKQINRGQLREHLEAGDSQPVNVLLTGKAAKQKIALPVRGLLNVGHDSQTSRAPTAAHVLALALERMTGPKRAEFLEALPAAVKAAGELPAAQEEFLELAKLCLKRCALTSTRRGSVVFVEEF